METPSKITKLLLIVLQYIRQNWIYAGVLAYMLISVLANLLFHIDIGVPCIITLITGHNCPGCGLTRATGHLFGLNIKDAWNMNPFVFIVLPAVAFFIISDFRKFFLEKS